jgi:hypothetical protein
VRRASGPISASSSATTAVLQGDAGEPTPNGYMITVACRCGVTFYRWIAPVDAAYDLTRLARLN